MSKNKSGLVFGLFLALWHLVWSAAVAISPSGVESFYRWVLKIHHINIPMSIVTPFVLMNAIILIILTFISGYVMGWVFAWLFNTLHK